MAQNHSSWANRFRPAPQFASQSETERLLHLLKHSRKDGERREALLRLVTPGPERASEQAHEPMLEALQLFPELMLEPDVARYLIEEVPPETFRVLNWETPEDVVEFSEMLYRCPLPENHERWSQEEMAEVLTKQAHEVLREAFLQFERTQELESVFQLLRIAPSSLAMSEAELYRLRNRTHRYEIRRIQQNRRWLYGYLLSQVLLVFVCFPILFMYAENGLIQQKIEEATTIELPDEQKRFLTFPDALYWSIITAASIGYGDVTPSTSIGRIMASVLGISGVITVGIVAGLVIDWISPRRLRI